MVETGEPGLCRDICDRVRGRLQEFLRMGDSNEQNFVKDRTLEFITKGTFQRPPRNSAVGNDIVH